MQRSELSHIELYLSRLVKRAKVRKISANENFSYK